jgi:uncharacterized protein involved in exopolysaccharide biosynthesis
MKTPAELLELVKDEDIRDGGRSLSQQIQDGDAGDDEIISMMEQAAYEVVQELKARAATVRQVISDYVDEEGPQFDDRAPEHALRDALEPLLQLIEGKG